MPVGVMREVGEPQAAPGAGPSSAPASWPLPMAHLAVAALALLLGAAAVPVLAPELAGHYYQPHVLALTHVFTLGWLTLGLIGLADVLLPAALDRSLWSERLASWTFKVLVAGVIGMTGHFYLAAWPGLVLATGLVGIGVMLHVANVVLTVRGTARWSFAARLMIAAHAGLLLTTFSGALRDL